MCSFGANFLDALNTAGTCADYCDALIIEVDSVLWPDSGMVYVTSEITQAFDRWGVSS